MPLPHPQRELSLVTLHFDAGSGDAGVTTTADVLTSRIHVRRRGDRVTIRAGRRARLTLPRSFARNLHAALGRALPRR